MIRTLFSRNVVFALVAGILQIVMLLSSPDEARAQAFANVKNAAVDYSKADVEPRMACESLAAFKTEELVQLTARAVPAAESAPGHCRVSGVLAPEIGFEVNLPARWNGRFYMIGNGGHAGEGPDDPGRAMPLLGDQQLRNLHRVRRRAFAEVVAHAPERQAVRAG